MRSAGHLSGGVVLPDVPRPGAGAGELHGDRGPRPVRGESGAHRLHAVERPGPPGLRSVLPGARAEPAPRPTLRRVGRRADRRAPGGGAQLRLLGEQPRSRRVGPEQDAHGERLPAHHRRRGAAGLSRNHARGRGRRLGTDHDADRDEPVVGGLGVAPYVSLLPLRTAPARRPPGAGAGGDQRDLRTDPAGSRGTAPGVDDRSHHGALPQQARRGRGRRARTEHDARGGQHAAPASARHHRGRPPHRVRQHRQPPPRPRGGTRSGDGDPRIARREPAADVLPAARRVVPARRARRARQPRGRPLDAPADRGRTPARGDADARPAPESDDDRLRGRTLARDRRPLRDVSRRPQHAAGPGGHAQDDPRAALERSRRATIPESPGHRPDRPLDDAPRLGGPLHQEPGQREPRGSRPRHREHRHLLDLPGAERLRGGALRRALRTGA